MRRLRFLGTMQYSVFILIILLLSYPSFALNIWSDPINTVTVGHDALWSVPAANTQTSAWCLNCPYSINGASGGGTGGFWLYRPSNLSTTEIYQPFTYSATFNITAPDGKEYLQADNTSTAFCSASDCIYFGAYGVGGAVDIESNCIGSVPSSIAGYNPVFNSVNNLMIVFNTSNTSFWLNGTMIKSCPSTTSLNYSQVRRLHLAKEQSGNLNTYWDNLSVDTLSVSVPPGENITSNNQTGIIQGVGLNRYDMDSMPRMIFLFTLIFLWLALVIMEYTLGIQLLSIFQFILGLFIGVVLSSVHIILCIAFILVSLGLLTNTWVHGR